MKSQEAQEVTKEMLEKEMQTLRIALKAAEVLTWRYDRRTHRITDSGTLREAFGLPQVVENIPESILEEGFIAEESCDTFRQLIQDADADYTVSAVLKSTIKGEYGDVWYRNIYTPTFDEDGNYIDSVAISINVSEQKHKEQDYNKQLQLNRTLAKDALSSVTMNLTQNTVTDFYSSSPIFTNYEKVRSADELLGSIDQTVSDEDDRKKFAVVADAKAMIEAYKAGTKHIEIVVHRDETTTWQKVTYDMIENPYTGDIEAISAIYDVTDSIRAQLVVERLMEIDYQSISLIDMHTQKSVSFKDKYWDANMSEFRDIQMEEYDNYDALLAFFQKYAPPGMADKIAKDNSIAVIKQELEHSLFYENTYSLIEDGYVNHYRAMYSYLEKDQSALLCAVQDITELYENEKKQKEALAHAAKKAQAANKAKTDFLSRVSHDMRTPINGILGITTLLKDKTENDEILQDLTRLELSGQYLLSLVNDTLDVSKIETGVMELHPTVCDGQLVFQNIVKLMQPNMEAKQITIEVDASRMPYELIYVDEGRLQQIAMNILGNAVKFTPERGHISLMAETIGTEGNIVIDRFRVEDNGCGMSEEFLPRLFEPFSQENSSTTNSKDGTGLGMSITKHIVDLMNGEIHVESEPGKGTCVDIVLRIPLATEEQKEAWKKNHNAHTIDHHESLPGKKVLLCEDHPLNMQITKRLLEKMGVKIEHAENGQIGVAMFEASAEGYYDAILMDIRMPVMDGVDAAHTIRNLPRAEAQTIPIIALTANALDDDVKRTQEAGMNAHLSKPINPEQLYRTLEEYFIEYKRTIKN